MPEEKPSLHIDDDWKKQAQEEKRRLAEQQQKTAAAPAAAPRVPPGGLAVGPTGVVPGDPRSALPAPGAAGSSAAAGRGARGARQLPDASFATLVQSILTQALFYLGELSPYGGEPTLNLDMARHQIDTLGVLEQKTANNLGDDEKRLLDAALYDLRTRFVSVASQFINP